MDNKKMVTLNIPVHCEAMFESIIEIPIELLSNERLALNYIESHINEVPVTRLSYIEDSKDIYTTESVKNAIRKYNKLHKCNLLELLEKVPNVELNEDGIPYFCPHHVGLKDKHAEYFCCQHCEKNKNVCRECWLSCNSGSEVTE